MIIGIVVVVRVIVGVVVAIAAVIATVVVPAVPGRIAVVRTAVIDHGGAVPPTVPTAVSPAATSAAHQCSDSDPGAEANDSGSGHVSRAVPGSHIRRAVNYRGVVLGNVNDLRVGWLNDDRLWRLLHHGDLRAGLEIASCFSLRAQSLDRGHYLGLLVVICLSQRGRPGEIVRQVIEH